MKARLQTSLGQQLVMTPQLRQAIRLLQMSSTELELELAGAVESNPLLEWADEAAPGEPGPDPGSEPGDASAAADAGDGHADAGMDWPGEGEQWSGGQGGSFDDDDSDARDRVAGADTLADHLLWQLHLSHLSARDRAIGVALVDALDEDGYLREPLLSIAQTLRPDIAAGEDEILTMLHRIQRFDPPGVGARTLGECLGLQLDALPAFPVSPPNCGNRPRPSSRPCSCCARWTRARAGSWAKCPRTPMWCPTAWSGASAACGRPPSPAMPARGW